MERLVNLPEPKAVFGIFSEYAKIPHGSGNTAGATAFCVDFAKKHGLSCETDGAGNVIIRKDGSKGFTSHPTLILQGHLDMVCEKTADKVIDFEKDGLELFSDGDFIFADRTTLGGDDGIAVAMILALLSDETLSHPPIEAVFTTDEETGMDGARALDCSRLKGKTLINLDSEDENTLWVSCAGGARANIEIPVERTESKFKNAYCVKLSGLCGGHSGTEIDKGRINAVKALSKILSVLNKTELCEFSGGLMDNAIPREASAVIRADEKDEIEAQLDLFSKELKASSKDDSALTLTIEPAECSALPLTDECKDNVLGFINDSQNGVIAMSQSIKGLVETSLNLGIMKLEETKLLVSFSLRSSKNSAKEALCNSLCACTVSHGGSFSLHGEYPAWEYNEVSRVRDVISKEYEALRNEKCEVRAIHAGLECGIFYDKIPGLDCVSFGPNIYDIHTPDERLSVSSVQRVYELLKKVLGKL